MSRKRKSEFDDGQNKKMKLIEDIELDNVKNNLRLYIQSVESHEDEKLILSIFETINKYVNDMETLILSLHLLLLISENITSENKIAESIFKCGGINFLLKLFHEGNYEIKEHCILILSNANIYEETRNYLIKLENLLPIVQQFNLTDNEDYIVYLLTYFNSLVTELDTFNYRLRIIIPFCINYCKSYNYKIIEEALLFLSIITEEVEETINILIDSDFDIKHLFANSPINVKRYGIKVLMNISSGTDEQTTYILENNYYSIMKHLLVQENDSKLHEDILTSFANLVCSGNKNLRYFIDQNMFPLLVNFMDHRLNRVRIEAAYGLLSIFDSNPDLIIVKYLISQKYIELVSRIMELRNNDLLQKSLEVIEKLLYIGKENFPKKRIEEFIEEIGLDAKISEIAYNYYGSSSEIAIRVLELMDLE